MYGVGNGQQLRRAAGAVIGAAALLAGTAGCSGPATEGAAAGAPTGSAVASPAGAPGPGVERLKELVVAEGEKFGPYEVTEPLLDEPMSELYEARPAGCLPLTSLGKAGHTAQAYAKASVPGRFQAVGTEILLRSYRDAGAAAAAVKSLADAGGRCAGGYTEDRALAEAKVLKVEAVQAPALGDEARAYRIVTQDVKDPGISLYKYLTLVRSGAVTLAFRSDVIDTKDFGGVPQEIVAGQWEKFAKGTAASAS
ncbi:hypothetical protein OHB36_34990 [Streptomyces sp. NBC_00320]|uniref:hypothetical protein n=1 Tax=Streptomyces sp. NBC_00320 TaxID=2975711 RepID=UPI00225B4DFA|nr:hypothetical protein [Streptomyces sp. NBC_00320]MCX5151899.1 hypothetical protein [Streptomyces sp. NBC_00320]